MFTPQHDSVDMTVDTWLPQNDIAGDSESEVSAPIFPAVSNVTVSQEQNLTRITFPGAACLDVRATPLVVGDYLVLVLNRRANCSGDATPHADKLLGVHLPSGALVKLSEDVSGVATPTARIETNQLVGPDSRKGELYWLRLPDFTKLPGGTLPNAPLETSPIFLAELLYLGSDNPPGEPCNGSSPLDDCGAFFGIDKSLKIAVRLDLPRGFRGRTTASPTSDGVFMYLGTGSQLEGDSGSKYQHGCSVVKLNRALAIEARFDPGDTGCRKTGEGVDQVSGEVVHGADIVWAQFAAPVSDDGKLIAVQLDDSLAERCRATLATSVTTVASSFYQGPTVDHLGRLYAIYSTTGSALVRVALDCSSSPLLQLPQPVLHSPTLADDQFILLASAGTLRIIKQSDGSVVGTHTLASNADVIAAPIVKGGVIAVIARDGGLTLIRQSGVNSYGKALWPRYRGDNHGTGFRQKP